MTSPPHSHHSHQHSDTHQHSDRDQQTRQRWLAAQWSSFIAPALPPSPARLLEIGCGSAGGIIPAALTAGYDAVGVDPDAPNGPAYRCVPFEDYEPPSPVDAVVSLQALHHLPNLDDAFARVARMLNADGVLVIVEWAWERINEATARWIFAHVPAGGDPGWGERRDSWQASGLPWEKYRDRWAGEHGLHSWSSVETALKARFDTVSQADVPALFGDVAQISEAAERAAVDAGEIAATGVHWVGHRRASETAQ